MTPERSEDPPGPAHPATLGAGLAAALVFGASASVLVVEIVALRLLAPYLGLTLETSTLVIGLALAAIATGSWIGGRWADARDCGPLLPVLLGVSGLVIIVTPFAVRASGTADAGTAGAGGTVLLVAAVTIAIPGILLSAVTPIVTKLRLSSLTETGTVVGRLSAIGTTGAIVGTVVTGFVLISRMPVTWIMVGLGVLLILAAMWVGLAGWRRPSTKVQAAALAATLVGGLGAAIAPSGCDAETQYHCAVVETDPMRPNGRVLILDGLWHSYVDLVDPTYLEFSYIRALTAAVAASYPAGEPLSVHFLGGGGLTLPRFLPIVRPGTTSTVSEIDAGVVRIDRERLGFRDSDQVRVRLEDARIGLRDIPPGSQDLVVGDAFGGVSVPWHLTTRESIGQVKRALEDDGAYAVNLIDHGPLAFARAELATLASVFDHVALAATTATTQGRGGGNLVALASDTPIDVAAWRAELIRAGVRWTVIDGPHLRSWIGDSPVLTDDFAPVDQFLTPYG